MNNQITKINKSLVDLNNRQIFSYIYTKGFQQIALDGKEYNTDFMRTFLTNDTITELMNLYLNVVEKTDPEKFSKLRKSDTERNFELSEVLDSMSNDFTTDFQNYGMTFEIFNFLRNKKKEPSPLETIIETQVFKTFLEPLNLNLNEKIFFVLNLLNSVVGWIFPFNRNNEYKAKLLGELLPNKSKSNINLANKLNNKFISLGLFSSPWIVNGFVTTYFDGELTPFCAKKVVSTRICSTFDYEDLYKKNEDELKLSVKLTKESAKNKTNLFQVIKSSDDIIIEDFLSYCVEKSSSDSTPLCLYKIEKNDTESSVSEIIFNIYAYATLLPNNSVLYLDEDLMQKICCQHSRFDNRNGYCFNLLKLIRRPVFIGIQKLGDEIFESLENQNLAVHLTTEIKNPTTKNYCENLIDFCYQKKVSPRLTKAIVDKCVEYQIKPVNWEKTIQFISDFKSLTKQDINLIFDKKYGSVNHNNLRKNQNYSYDALNTSIPVNELIQSIKNAEEAQNGEYSCDSGVRIENYGESGTGKTAFVEQVAKSLNKPLMITRASDILDCYVGGTEKNIRQIFEDAAESKSILLIDEADSFLHSRGDTLNKHNDSKVNEFLVQMERFPGILFCNTNFPENLDKASSRRFHFVVEFKPLTKNGIKTLCNTYFHNFDFSDENISTIYNSGSVTPGDFGSLFNKIRFMNKEKQTKEFIIKELCKTVEAKTLTTRKTIGFGA